MSEIVTKLVAWTTEYSGEPIPPDLVPGTSDAERRRLAALGAVARELGGDRLSLWPLEVRDWVTKSPLLPSDLGDELRECIAEDETALALVYQRIVSGRSRRRLGTFFTPPAVVEFLLDRAEQLVGTPGLVIDPGAGIGAITLAACRRWPEARIYAVDLNVVTLGLLAGLAAWRNVNRVELVYEDYLQWIALAPTPSGVTRLIAGNPPYTRHQEMPKTLGRVAREAAGGLVTSGLASLSAYFLAASLHALTDEDGLVFVLPGSWTETRYGQEIRQRLWDEARRPTTMYSFPSDVHVFPGTNVTSMVLAVGSRQSGEQTISVCPVRVEGDVVRMDGAKQLNRNANQADDVANWLWTRRDPPRRDFDHTVPLAELARVRRGVATGAKNFFFLTDSEKAVLPEGAVVRALLHLRDATISLLDETEHDAIGARGGRRWLFRPVDPNVQADDHVTRYIGYGEEQGLQHRYLARERKPWFIVENVQPPDILIGCMGRRRLQAVVNAARVIPSNAIYGLYLGLQAPSAPSLAAWLNGSQGQDALRSVARHYGGGLLKLEPRSLLQVRIPKDIAITMGR